MISHDCVQKYQMKWLIASQKQHLVSSSKLYTIPHLLIFTKNKVRQNLEFSQKLDPSKIFSYTVIMQICENVQHSNLWWLSNPKAATTVLLLCGHQLRMYYQTTTNLDRHPPVQKSGGHYFRMMASICSEASVTMLSSSCSFTHAYVTGSEKRYNHKYLEISILII